MRADSRENSLNALRQFVDDLYQGRYPGLYVLVTGTPQFFDGPQGVQRAPALASRLATEFAKDARFDSARAPQIRLMPFDLEKLVEVGKHIRDLYPSEARERILSKVDDALLHTLALGIAGKLGGKVGIAPRIYLKRVVDVIDRVDEHPEFDPREHYELVVKAEELTDEERGAAGIAKSPNDLDLDVAVKPPGGARDL